MSVRGSEQNLLEHHWFTKVARTPANDATVERQYFAAPALLNVIKLRSFTLFSPQAKRGSTSVAKSGRVNGARSLQY